MRELENYGHEGTKNDVGFAETEAFTWLKAHAHEYGFILRYPETKTNLTGYSYESWHYRFVGREAASIIHYQNITLEEYLTK
jgi:D-alanyl-D-alanine carboxypeptidase